VPFPREKLEKILSSPSPVGNLRWSALEWEVLRLWQEALEGRFVLLHAGAVSLPGRGAVLLPGRTGTGKTTFTLALVSRGWTYFSDDCAALDPDTLDIRPVPGAAHLRGTPRGRGRISLRTLPSETSPTGTSAFPRRRHLPLPGESSPVRAILFPAHDREDLPPGEAVPLAPGMAAYELAFHSMARGQQSFLRDFRAVCRLARSVPAFRLSTRDLDRASLLARDLLA